jgi:hypothetical protein
MEAEFEDIRIVDLDLAKTTWSRVHDSLRVMFLRLDREPPDTDWPRLFFEERESRIVARRRGLWIEDNYISFDSLPDEVEKIHIPDINHSIAYANRKYRELCWQRRLKRLENIAELRSERDEMLALQQRLRGLFSGGIAAASTAAAAPEPAAAPQAVAAAVPEPAAAQAVAAVAPEPAAATLQAVAAATPEPAPAAPPASVAAAAPVIPKAPATPDASAPAPADPLTDFQTRRDALKQLFRSAASAQDKEHK